MTSFYNQTRPIIENGKLVLISNGGSRSIVGIRAIRKALNDLESKNNLRSSSIETRDMYRAAVALWETNR